VITLEDKTEETASGVGGFVGPFMAFVTDIGNGLQQTVLLPVEKIKKIVAVDYAKRVIVEPDGPQVIT